MQSKRDPSSPSGDASSERTQGGDLFAPSHDAPTTDGNATSGPRGGVRQVGSIVGERYRVKAHLGRRREGELYEVVDRSLSDPHVQSERSVVLHVLNERIAQQPGLLQRIEASYLQPHSWAHRNMVGVLGFGADQGQYFFVTDMLEGRTLRTIIDERSPERLSEEEAFAIVCGAGDALKYAHAKGVVHGDIRPESIFITPDLVVKVRDFLPASLPRLVPSFPEDTVSDGVAAPDPRDDVYGLASVAYELFSGRHPFNSNTALDASTAAIGLVPIARLDPRSWEAIARGLALYREQRTKSIAAFLAELGVTGRERLHRDPGVRSHVAEKASASEPTTPPVAEEKLASAARRDAEEALALAALRDADGAFASEARRDVEQAPASAPLRDATMPPFAPSREQIDHGFYAFDARRSGLTNKRRIPWSVLLVLFAVGAGAALYWNAEWLRPRETEWLAMGRSFAERLTSRAPNPRPSAVEREAAEPPSAATPPTLTPDGAQTPAKAAAPDAATPKAAAPDAATPKAAAPEPAAPKAVPEAAVPKVATSEAAAPTAATPEAARAAPPTSAASAVDARGAPVPETFEPETRVVVVSERAPSAAIAIRRHGGDLASSSVVWWTSDGTAVANEDYVDLGARVEKFAPGEQVRTIYIPIINDSKREGRESFYVNLRSGRSESSREPAERVEVVIEDDD